MTSELLIGMKLADHTMYPLYELGERGMKTLTLAAAHDNQERIDLRFFYKESEKEAVELISIKLDKDQVPGKQWGDLQLKCDLDRSTGFQVQISMSNQELVSQLVKLPDALESEDTAEPVSRSKPVLSLILAALFLAASVYGAYYTGNSLSSEAPPQLLLQPGQNPDNTTD